MRIASIYFPRLLIQIKTKKDASLVGKPVAVHYSRRIVDVSQEAEKHGVKKEMGLRQAQSLCPECLFIPLDRENLELAFKEITETLFSITPSIERDGDFFFLDVAHISDEGIKNIRGIIKERVGLEAKIGVALRKFLSKMASILTDEILIIPAEKEEEFLKEIPIDCLPFNEDLKKRLKLLGLDKVEDILRLPSSFFYVYLGKDGINLLKLLEGSKEERLIPIVEDFKEKIELSFDVPKESIYDVLSEIDRVLDGFDEKRTYPSRVELFLLFTDNRTLKKEFLLKEENASKDVLLIRIKAFLEKIKDNKPLKGLTITLSEFERKRGIQLGLFTFRKRDILSTITFLRKKYGRGVICEAFR
ncbi:MAG: hypothetical protein NZ583_07365 [Desulfobacterota bacterium]|nr:hypothetical protein [Thermodesulfobacteriota bacterium]MDW8002819.1 hypothetical protein [Deltaproteobacteria bacterium]